MNICFRQVTQHDLDKFPLWYRRIQGKDLFTHFIPTSFRSFEEEIDLIWLIILSDDEEIGTIWFERKDKYRRGYALGIYLNRVELFGKGIGRRAIRLAIDNILKEKDVDEFYLDVRKKNTRAIRCYESLGFVTIQDGIKTTDYGTIEFHSMILKIQADNLNIKRFGIINLI